MTCRKILLVEDDPLIVRGWRRVLKSSGWDVHAATTLAHARAALTQNDWRVVVVDLQLPDGDGADLLAVLAPMHPKPIIIVASGYVTAERIKEFPFLPPLVVPKPLTGGVLISLVETLDSQGLTDWLQSFCAKHRLTQRETEIVELATVGIITNKDTAAKLEIEPGTVGSYWSRICRKTGHQTRQDVLLAAFCHRSQLKCLSILRQATGTLK